MLVQENALTMGCYWQRYQHGISIDYSNHQQIYTCSPDINNCSKRVPEPVPESVGHPVLDPPVPVSHSAVPFS